MADEGPGDLGDGRRQQMAQNRVFENLMSGVRPQLYEGRKEDFEDWAFDLKKRCRLHQLSNEQSVDYAVNCTKGRAARYALNIREDNPAMSLAEFEDMMRARFVGEGSIYDARRAMKRVRKTRDKGWKDVADEMLVHARVVFRGEEDLSSPVVQGQLLLEFLEKLSNFVDIKREVLRIKPVTLEDAVRAAVEHEDLMRELEVRDYDDMRCFDCGVEGHRARVCPQREGLPDDFYVPYCQRCKTKGHPTKWCGRPPLRRTPQSQPGPRPRQFDPRPRGYDPPPGQFGPPPRRYGPQKSQDHLKRAYFFVRAIIGAAILENAGTNRR